MRTLLITAVFLLATSGVFAASITDTYVVPLAGHVAGANGETWATDVILHNPEPTALVVDIAHIGTTGPGDEPAVQTVTVAPHGTLTLPDLLEPGRLGSLLIAGTYPFSLRARVHADSGHGSFGTDIAPAGDFIDGASGGAYLIGLTGNTRHRSNIGFLALAGDAPLQIEVKIIDPTGMDLGSRVVAVDGGDVAHVHLHAGEIAAGEFEGATAHVRVIAGDGVVIPYGTVVDNLSSDATFIAPSNGGALIAPDQFRRRVQRLINRGQR